MIKTKLTLAVGTNFFFSWVGILIFWWPPHNCWHTIKGTKFKFPTLGITLNLLHFLTKMNRKAPHQELHDCSQLLGFLKKEGLLSHPLQKISDYVVNDSSFLTEGCNNLHASCSCSRGWLGSPLFSPKQSVLWYWFQADSLQSSLQYLACNKNIFLGTVCHYA